MSKTTNMSRHDLRWQLLVTVSAAALLASAYGAGEAEAADTDRPQLWLELGGQLERLSEPQDQFAPSFLASITHQSLLSALDVQQPSPYAIAADGSISFQPKGSDWVFSASIRYGRSRASRHHHQQTANAKVPWHISFPAYNINKYGTYYPYQHVRFSDGTARESERHLTLDFQAGKDVGLGMFGSHGSSVVSAGVRFAQFNSKSNVTLRALPDLQYPSAPASNFAAKYVFKHSIVDFHAYNASAKIERSFQGGGPSLAWNASMPFAGSSQSGTLTVDWGLNAAVLFGRQKAKGRHQTNAQTYHMTQWRTKPGARGAGMGNEKAGFFSNPSARKCGFAGYPQYCRYGNYNYTNDAIGSRNNAGSIDRSRRVAVPNLGGFAGISFRYADAKLSLGYRADFFFGAIDGGIDTRKSENRGFFGPFASISVGLGD